MTKEIMTIHKALAELKVLESRIMKTVGDGTYCVANKHSNEKINGVSVEDYKKVMQGAYDKAVDLITRYKTIKKAVTLSNAKTVVKIGEEEYTVAEAIWMKNHGVEFDELLLNELREQYNKAQAKILRQNGNDLDQRAEQYVVGIYGSKEGKTNTDDFEKTKQDFITSQTFELVDPIGILEKIEVLEEKISVFKAEVDAVLSTSNALTVVEINY